MKFLTIYNMVIPKYYYSSLQVVRLFLLFCSMSLLRSLRSVFIVFLLLAGICSYGQAPAVLEHTLLWKISGKDAQGTSYLFGTMHMICVDDYVWNTAMQKSFSASEKVCFEMDLDDPQVMMQVATGMIDQSGKKLKDYFTDVQYQLLKQYIKDSAGLDIAMFEQMKPIALQTIMGFSQAGCTSQTSYEDSLSKTATQSGKEIIGLEDAREQLDVLESLPTDSVIADIVSMLNHTARQDETEYKALISAYTHQDLNTLYRLISNSKSLGAELPVFLDDRNKRWIPRMASKMKQSTVFFAVGAGHLAGPNGVISLLRAAGYKVEAVK